MQGLMSHLNKSLIRLVPLALIIVFIIGAIGPSPVQADPGWYDTDWQYRKKIIINSSNVTGDLTDFPVLISIVSDGDIGSHAQLDGEDILFTQGDEVSKIPHEIESFSSNGATANLTAWVKIPNLSSTTDTDIYIYYGNGSIGNQEDPTNVWDSNFQMVQHMEEASGGPGAITDSTSYNNNGTDYNSPTFGASGKNDGAIGFVGTSAQYIDCGNDSSLDITGNITVEAWIYPTDSNTNKGIVAKYQGTNPSYYLLFDGTGHIDFVVQSSPFTRSADAGTPSTNNWHHVVGVYDQSKVRIFLNGVETIGDNYFSTIDSTSSIVTIGSWYDNTSSFDFTGIIDEVRISNTNRSADWIKTSYNNQSNPSAFFTLGSEQNAPAPVAVGGKILIVNKAMVLAPWILIAIALCIVIIRLIQHFRKKTPSRSPHEDNS